MFNNHIIRSKWNYQFTRALSLRVIGQYNAVLSNYDPVFPTRALSSLAPAKSSAEMSCDVLRSSGNSFLYWKYNSDLQNLNRSWDGIRAATCCVRPASSSMTGADLREDLVPVPVLICRPSLPHMVVVSCRA